MRAKTTFAFAARAIEQLALVLAVCCCISVFYLAATPAKDATPTLLACVNMMSFGAVWMWLNSSREFLKTFICCAHGTRVVASVRWAQKTQ